MPCGSFLCFTVRYLCIWCCLIDRIFKIAVCFQSKYFQHSSVFIRCKYYQLNTFHWLSHKHMLRTQSYYPYLDKVPGTNALRLPVIFTQCSLLVSKPFLHSSNSSLVRKYFTHGDVILFPEDLNKSYDRINASGLQYNQKHYLFQNKRKEIKNVNFSLFTLPLQITSRYLCLKSPKNVISFCRTDLLEKC